MEDREGSPDDDVFPAACPIRRLISHITSRWGLLVLLALSVGARRWSELHGVVQGASEKMLASALRDLIGDDLVARDASSGPPRRVDYSLTPRGLDLAQRLLPLAEWVHQEGRRADALRSADPVLQGADFGQTLAPTI